MTPTDPTPPAVSSRHRAPGAAQGHHLGHQHDEHLYSEAELHNQDVAHEHSDVNVRAVIASAVGMAVIVGLCALASLGLMMFLESQAAANEPVMSPLAQPAGQLPPEPRLLTNEPQYLDRFRTGVAERLKGIDEGKKQLLQQGLPVRPNAPTDPWMGTQSPSRGESSGGRAIPLRPGVGGETPAAPPAPPKAAPAPVKGGGH